MSQSTIAVAVVLCGLALYQALEHQRTASDVIRDLGDGGSPDTVERSVTCRLRSGMRKVHSALLFRYRRTREKQLINFHLPLTMEKILLASQAGRDVIAAISAASNETLNGEAPASGKNGTNPVARLLERALLLHARGLTFEKSLEEVASSVNSVALKHAFFHLSIAHRFGGELTGPLRELSDAVQLHYQDTAEEEIAKLPVKATLPLICIFAGLILSFLTTPLVEILDLTTRGPGVISELPHREQQ